jgi:hypothetical protein
MVNLKELPSGACVTQRDSPEIFHPSITSKHARVVVVEACADAIGVVDGSARQRWLCKRKLMADWQDVRDHSTDMFDIVKLHMMKRKSIPLGILKTCRS